MRAAVVGQLEWVELLRVEHVPEPGEIVHAVPRSPLPGGSGGVAAIQLARWGAETVFFTALGDDAVGHRVHDELRAWGVEVRCVFRATPQRRAIALVDAQNERTIVTIGDRTVPRGGDPLPWEELDDCDAVYVTGGDAGAVREARRAHIVVGTSRVVPVLRAAGVELDALVGSANDPTERYMPGDLDVVPRLVVRTDGARGGHYVLPDGTAHRYAAVPATVRGGTYAAGDTFAAALTFGLGNGRGPADAVAFAAARVAEVVAFDGPYPPRPRGLAHRSV
jgi:ribokinase